MVPSILVNTARGSKLVIGGAGGELIISAVAQVSWGTPGWNIPTPGGGRKELVYGGCGHCPLPPLLCSPSLPQAIINKLWLDFDLRTAIAAPILHVNSKGHVEYEPTFSQVRPLSLPPPGLMPRCMLLKAPSGISATESLQLGSLPLLGPSIQKLSVGGARPVLWPLRQRTGCHPCFSQARHLCPFVSALFCSLQMLVFLAVALQTLSYSDLFPYGACSFHV